MVYIKTLLRTEKCVVCGKEFQTKNSVKKYCSKRCWQDNYNKFKRESKEFRKQRIIVIYDGGKMEAKKKSNICRRGGGIYAKLL